MSAGYPQAHPPDNRQLRLQPLYQLGTCLFRKDALRGRHRSIAFAFLSCGTTYTPHRRLTGGVWRMLEDFAHCLHQGADHVAAVSIRIHLNTSSTYLHPHLPEALVPAVCLRFPWRW